MRRSEDAVCWTLAGLLLAAWAVSLWMGCGPGRDGEPAAASTNGIELVYTNSITATGSNGVIYYTGTIHTNDLTTPRHDPSLTSATRHHLASLGFSYGVQAERGRWTGDTNSLAFTEERLREVVDGMGRDDAAPWGPRPRAIGREDTNGVERVAEDAAPGREDTSDVERVSEEP